MKTASLAFNKHVIVRAPLISLPPPQAGTGTEPSLHARCLVHYCGKLLSNGEVFMDSAQESNAGEPVAIVAGRCVARWANQVF